MRKAVLLISLIAGMGAVLFAQQLTVAVSTFEARGGLSKDDGDAVTDLFISALVSDGTVNVVDRNNFDKIMAEMEFQASDWTDSNKVLELGKMLKATSLIRGSVMTVAGQTAITTTILNLNNSQIISSSTLQMKDMGEIFNKLPGFVKELMGNLPKPQRTVIDTGISIEVITKIGGILYFQNEEIATMWDNDIHAIPIERPGTYTIKLVFGNGGESTRSVAIASRGITKVDFSILIIGDAGPAGGIVFYDKGNNSNGWRYLEAAPVDAQAKWSVHGTKVGYTRYTIEYTQSNIGSGKQNTQFIVEKFSQTSGEWDTAAQKADDLVFGGFNDWFLPSQAELDLMYGNLKRRNIGNFKNESYWSSSEYSASSAHDQNFSDGRMDYNSKNYQRNVRAIRQVPGPNTGRSSVDDIGVTGNGIAGTTGTTKKSKRSAIGVLASVGGVLLLGGLLGYIGYVVISNPDGGRAAMATP